MISIEQISGEIAALEEEKPTHLTMQKLAALYTVRDHMVIGERKEPEVVVSGTIPMISETEFSKTIYDMDTKSVMGVIDELMETLRIMQPKLYEATIRKLTTLIK